MKVLFLDFDGVINPYGNNLVTAGAKRTSGELFSKPCCDNLKSLLNKVPDLKIVISSAWRMWGVEYVSGVLAKNGVDGSRVIDVTGQENGNRGHQIQCWLDRNKDVTNIVIIDDESDMGELMNKLVKTSGFIGLTSKEVDLALEVLEIPLK